jgi:predicted acetyltransferase
VDGRPACGLVTIERDGSAGIFAVATLPEARGRGLTTRLLGQALADARERGCSTSTLQATKRGAPVYDRLGYRSLGAIEMWERR